MDKAKILRTLKTPKLIAGVIIATLVLILIARNLQEVEPDLLILRVKTRVAVLILVTFILGAGFGFLGGSLYTGRRLRKDEGEKKKEAG